jgi:hypothetical protein
MGERVTTTPSVPQFTTAQRTRPAWLRPVNGLGRVLPHLAKPSADRWLASAATRSGVDATPTPEVVEALGVLVESLAADADLNLIGRFSAQQDTVRLLVNHLRVRSHVAARPEIASTALPAPVFIIGIPRSGTTFLHHLLSHDPDNRVVPYWESFAPVPPEGPDLRCQKVDTMLGQLRVMAPNYQAIHPMSGASPEECVALFMNVVRTLQMDIQYRVPDYTSWLVAQDARIAYAAYAEQLRVISHHRPVGSRLVLKDPAHTYHLETILEVFPDARFVFLHRDPVETISSICSLYAHTRALFSDAVDPREVGREVLGGHWPEATERMLSMRADLPADRFADVRQRDLAADPVVTAASIYDHFGWALTEPAEAEMRGFATGGLSDFRRKHEHSLAGFGLDAAGVRDRFGEYPSDFDL